ncbi:MAG: hypothetical protein H6906_13700 [Hyphomicrobiales bacterium]|nr:hypothetical protein [Hyphomicrobiales bacterium]
MPQAGAPQPGAAGGVVINGRPLGPQQVAEIRQRYGIDPSPGAYWYDARSGLYGVVGYPAFGFMYPGHAYGPLDPNASAGDTNVFMNGRQLPQKEWLVWSQLLGYAIRPGRYWLDGQGNAGTEGSATIQDNLYVAARRNAYRGGGGGTGGGTGGGGDNFWSSRFGRGNWDQGGSRGYVSVPGHGPIGYGF